MDRLEEIKKELSYVKGNKSNNAWLTWQEADWLISEIERLKKEKEDLVLVSKGREAMTKAQAKLISRAEKEKEWLIKGWARTRCINDKHGGIVKETLEQITEFILKSMQQALKEEGNEFI